MRAVKVLLVLLAFVLNTRGDVRARDPEVEREEDEQGDRGGTVSVIGATKETPPIGGNYPARSGNWCAFVQKRMVTVAAACGTEKYTIKSQSPCPSGTPDCHLVMYKLSTRPLYKQERKLTTALLWRCCPGHGGDNCDDTVADAQNDSTSSEVRRAAAFPHAAGVLPQQQHSDPNRQQNDHQGSVNISHAQLPVRANNRAHSQHHDSAQDPAYGPKQDSAQDPVYGPNQDRAQDLAYRPRQDRAQDPTHGLNGDHQAHVAHQDHAQHPNQVLHPVQVQDQDPTQQPSHVQYPVQVQDRDPAQNSVRVEEGNLTQRPVHVWTQEHMPQPAREPKQPEHLRPGTYEEAEPASGSTVPAAEVALPHMVALLTLQLQPSLQLFNRSLEQLGRRLDDLTQDAAELEAARRRERAERADYEQRLNARVEQSVQQVAMLHRRLENALRSQQAMLHHNISNVKSYLMVSLQAMNTTLAELKLDQAVGQEQGEQQEAEVEAPLGEVRLAISQTSAVWEAIGRLDNMVLNTTVRVDELAEDLAATRGGVQQLRRDAGALGERLEGTARAGQVLFMETGLEVEAAKVAVLERVEQLAGNLSQQGRRLHEMDVDVDYLYSFLYKNNTSSPSPSQCDCGHLDEVLARLEVGVTNATELANENRLTLEEQDREAAMEALQRSLQQVKDWMTSEQRRTTALESSVRPPEARDGAPEASDGKLWGEMKRASAEMKRLSASFNSLVKDATRHSEVLETLLGEEVLEFLEWPVLDQEAHSIPALKEHLRVLEQTLGGRNLAAHTGNEPGDAEEAPSAVKPPSRWLGGAAKSRARRRTSREHLQQSGGDSGNLQKLERSVEKLKTKLLQMEAAPFCRDGFHGKEVARLKRGPHKHLGTFQN
ncbi:multimerin-2-like isoform X1 [Syngnathus acus]|uniref:multimerin-2-like isoform X1 n=1 Tax=Syngnathus acus TaxID=161584 RepID=UPI001885F14C|nr:multimerin-2-like isoform X1 [Syngnathus acus]